MSTSENHTSTDENLPDNQQGKRRTKKKTLGAGPKSKGASMVDIVSSAPTGTGYLETNPFQEDHETGEAATSGTDVSEATEPASDSASRNHDLTSSSGQQSGTPAAPPSETEASTDHSAPPTDRPETSTGSERVEPDPPTSEEIPKVSSWTVHAKNARAALLGVTKALDKVDARAQDVGEVLRTAGPSLPESDLIAIVHEVASRSGHPVPEIVKVANLDLPLH